MSVTMHKNLLVFQQIRRVQKFKFHIMRSDDQSSILSRHLNPIAYKIAIVDCIKPQKMHSRARCVCFSCFFHYTIFHQITRLREFSHKRTIVNICISTRYFAILGENKMFNFYLRRICTRNYAALYFCSKKLLS